MVFHRFGYFKTMESNTIYSKTIYLIPVGMNVWVRYLFVKEILLKGTISEATKWQKVNIAGIILGFLSALGISMVANFQVRHFLYITGYFRLKVLVYPLELWIENTHLHNTNETLSLTRSCIMYMPKNIRGTFDRLMMIILY